MLLPGLYNNLAGFYHAGIPCNVQSPKVSVRIACAGEASNVPFRTGFRPAPMRKSGMIVQTIGSATAARALS
ncbi:hypothetical protein OCOJLMKI_4957 [Methylobacterium iners]|uniref:Uncharacterized protein n=1 Tax=Methylobacterium iners TaxID=418707 RepID=A0ABQ4S779_9HYPH|nr:hypothetical protein OCOJLMKI_4957 [Methylobacterium iners]